MPFNLTVSMTITKIPRLIPILPLSFHFLLLSLFLCEILSQGIICIIILITDSDNLSHSHHRNNENHKSYANKKITIIHYSTQSAIQIASFSLLSFGSLFPIYGSHSPLLPSPFSPLTNPSKTPHTKKFSNIIKTIS
jgi:hypothetical protein